jgi:hypothetical protein
MVSTAAEDFAKIASPAFLAAVLILSPATQRTTSVVSKAEWILASILSTFVSVTTATSSNLS